MTVEPPVPITEFCEGWGPEGCNGDGSGICGSFNGVENGESGSGALGVGSGIIEDVVGVGVTAGDGAGVEKGEYGSGVCIGVGVGSGVGVSVGVGLKAGTDSVVLVNGGVGSGIVENIDEGERVSVGTGVGVAVAVGVSKLLNGRGLSDGTGVCIGNSNGFG